MLGSLEITVSCLTSIYKGISISILESSYSSNEFLCYIAGNNYSGVKPSITNFFYTSVYNLDSGS